jgi:Cu/Ag efflux protein CusF
MACKAAGKDKHVGVVMNIDQKTGTFTIRDAETDHPMTFQATAKQLQELKLKDQVMVSYKEQDGKLIALDIHS